MKNVVVAILILVSATSIAIAIGANRRADALFEKLKKEQGAAAELALVKYKYQQAVKELSDKHAMEVYSLNQRLDTARSRPIQHETVYVDRPIQVESTPRTSLSIPPADYDPSVSIAESSKEAIARELIDAVREPKEVIIYKGGRVNP